MARRLVQFGVLVFIMVAWYVATLPGGVHPLLLPPPAPVFRDFGVLLTTASVWPDLFVTVREWVTAFALASTAGCLTGYLVSRSGYAVRVFDPLFAGLYSVPAILLFPLYLLFFGLGAGSKIAIGTTIAFFPIVLNTIAGLSYVDKAYITAARSMGANGAQMFWSVMMPAAFPVILTGLRVGCIVAFLSILGGETISSLAGLGHRIVSLAENMETAQMFANILFAVAMAIIINGLVTFAEIAWTEGLPMNERKGPLLSPGLARLLVIIGLFGLWEILARLYADPLFLCPPSEAFVALKHIFSEPKIVKAIEITVYEMVTAFVIAVAFGMSVGLAVGLHGFTKQAILPVILLLYAIPQATILPLFVLSFGIGPEAKIAFGVSHGIFPVIVTTVAGVQNLRKPLLVAAQSMGASRFQIFKTIIFPHMIPSFFTGMRLGMTSVLLGVLLAELYVSTAGIGFYTRLFAESFSPPDLFALIAVLAAIAVTLNELCRTAERRFSRWHAM